MSPRITEEDLRRLKAKAARPTPKMGPGDVVVCYVPGILKNTKNARMNHWTEHKYKSKFREKTAHALLEAGWRSFQQGQDPATPKTVRFYARVRNLMDDDGLAVSLAPVRDELISCRVISGDAQRDGHRFVYEQVIDRTWRGVEVRVSMQ